MPVKSNIDSAGQAAVLFKHWPTAAQWFVVGGPGSSNEAQTVKAKYPAVHCIGFEPNPEMHRVQNDLDFPGIVYPFALWDEDITMRLTIPHGKNGANHLGAHVCGPEEDSPYDEITVPARTLDTLSNRYGTFSNCVLWIDIEYAELRALHGAAGLLGLGCIMLINLETFDDLLPPIQQYLSGHGFKLVERWNTKVKPNRLDAIFKLE